MKYEALKVIAKIEQTFFKEKIENVSKSRKLRESLKYLGMPKKL